MNIFFVYIFDIGFLKIDNKLKLTFFGKEEGDKIPLRKLEIENNELSDFHLPRVSNVFVSNLNNEIIVFNNVCNKLNIYDFDLKFKDF